MDTLIKFLILYLIPILSSVSSVGVYKHAYGKAPEDTFINMAFIFVALGFIASCFIMVTLVSKFSSGEIIYSGIVFSILAWLLELIVVGLYLVIFYDFINP
ncbi:MAG: hypothetical protein JKY50_04050 [Oleispira sp.]|nr:hypothetical protein [Oleispira sp.]MBL4881248.1 hypothetical protein [Oleispira sp.]